MRNLGLDKEQLETLVCPAWMDGRDFEFAKEQMRDVIADILNLGVELDRAWMVYRELRLLVDAEKEGCQLYGVPTQPKSKNRKRTKRKG